MSKKNCHTCEHLWRDSGESYAEWVCEKRQNNPPTVQAEEALIANMARDEYRNRYKRCFEPVLGAANTNKGGEGEN